MPWLVSSTPNRSFDPSWQPLMTHTWAHMHHVFAVCICGAIRASILIVCKPAERESTSSKKQPRQERDYGAGTILFAGCKRTQREKLLLFLSLPITCVLLLLVFIAYSRLILACPLYQFRWHLYAAGLQLAASGTIILALINFGTFPRDNKICNFLN
jgi:hypothetical protein